MFGRPSAGSETIRDLRSGRLELETSFTCSQSPCTHHLGAQAIGRRTDSAGFGEANDYWALGPFALGISQDPGHAGKGSEKDSRWAM